MKTINEHRAEIDPALAELAALVCPLAWQYEGGASVREASITIARRVQAHMQTIHEEAAHQFWHNVYATARADVARERIAQESSARYLLGKLWRVWTGRAEKPSESCPHQIRWDDCPDCSH